MPVILETIKLPRNYGYASVGEIIADSFRFMQRDGGTTFRFVSKDMIGRTITPSMAKEMSFIKPLFFETGLISWGYSTPEPDPDLNDRPGIQQLVIDDIQKRLDFGISKYGKPLQAYDGRKSLVEIYQEKLDEVIYWRKLLYEVYGE